LVDGLLVEVRQSPVTQCPSTEGARSQDAEGMESRRPLLSGRSHAVTCSVQQERILADKKHTLFSRRARDVSGLYSYRLGRRMLLHPSGIASKRSWISTLRMEASGSCETSAVTER
jgi:hypothetical protein